MEKVDTHHEEHNMVIITLKIGGMKCGGCEHAVQEAVKTIAGVISTKASHKEGNITIEYDPHQVEETTIRETIQRKGYSVS